MSDELFKKLADSWPSPLVARGDVARFSGGVLHPRTLANADARREGPAGKVSFGRLVAYDKDELISWMRARTTEPSGR